MIAVYNLRRYPACFNFIEFLVAASTHGATSVLLDDSRGYSHKYRPDVTKQRMESIVEPACALASMPFRYGTPEWAILGPGEAIDPGYHISAPLKAFQDLGYIQKLRTVKPAGTARYTVTLRDYDRIPKRNSDREAWLKFANVIGATVIDDYDRQTIHLHDRMALYAGAEMNFASQSGPMECAYFSDYPYLVFHKHLDLAYMEVHGWPEGTQLPWADERQRVVWTNDDSYDNIMRHWDLMQERMIKHAA